MAEAGRSALTATRRTRLTRLPVADLKAVSALARHWPYTTFLVVCLPILAHLMATDRLTSPWSVLLLAPFVLLMSAGYAYNNVQDLDDPPDKHNPVADGQLTPRFARLVVATLVIAAWLSFLLQYRTLAAYILFALFTSLVLAYSGLGVRFKETVAGPAVAVVDLWIGAPLILMAEFGLREPALMVLVAAAGVLFFGRETWHTVTDCEEDRHSGYRTFAVRAGPATADRVQRAAFLVGGVLLLVSIGLYAATRPAAGPLWAGLAIMVVVAVLSVRRPARGYALARLCLVCYALVILGLTPATTMLLAWYIIGSRLG